MSDVPCSETGCMHFTGGEIRHHKDCVHYPESFTKLNEDRIKTLEAENEKLIECVRFYASRDSYEYDNRLDQKAIILDNDCELNSGKPWNEIECGGKKARALLKELGKES